MAKRARRAGFSDLTIAAAVAAGVLWAAPAALARKKPLPPPPPPVRATVQPAFTIPAAQLGFAAEGENYLGNRNSLVSLDFLDEDRLLFTFRVPSLIRRTGESRVFERRIRAVVLGLPQGNVEAEDLWAVHDRAQYVYALRDGTFLFRDGNSLMEGDASLQLKPFLRFPGQLMWVESDPTGTYLVTGSHEPPSGKARPGEVGSPAGAQAQITTDGSLPETDPELVLRILRRDTGDVMLVSRIHDEVHVPLNSEGYLESRHGEGKNWNIQLNRFDGGEGTVGRVKSVCTPALHFVSQREFLVTTCDEAGDPALVAMTTSGRVLWHDEGLNSVWPILAESANGLRIARETLVVDHPVNALAPLQGDDIKGQDVQVFDAANGKQVLRAAASPVFDAGGNVAVSPSGRRVAIIMEGKIQVFNLPAPPPLPESAGRGANERAGRK